MSSREPVWLHLKKYKSVKPIHVTRVNPIPVHYKKESDEVIKSLVDAKIIRRVEGSTEWTSSGLFMPKGNSKMRLVTDYRWLNTILDRPVHPFPTTDMIRHSIGSKSRVFAKVDLVSAYHQLRIHPDDQELTTFLVPQGRYCYLRVPM